MPECRSPRRSVKPLSVVISIPCLGKCQCPQPGVGKPLVRGSPNVLYVATAFPEGVDGHQRDVLVYQDVHPSIAGDLNWRDLFFRERGGIIETSQDVFAGERRIFTQ